MQMTVSVLAWKVMIMAVGPNANVQPRIKCIFNIEGPIRLIVVVANIDLPMLGKGVGVRGNLL